MKAAKHPFWNNAPFLRLLPCIITGILIEWFVDCTLLLWITLASIALIVLLVFAFLPSYHRYHFGRIRGLSLLIITVATGGWICHEKNYRLQENQKRLSSALSENRILVLTETPVNKPRSRKANASILYTIRNNQLIRDEGNLMVYFRKTTDSSQILPALGSLILIRKPLQPIQNSSNPGGFDYRQYAYRQGFTHQVFLDEKEYVLLPGNKADNYHQFLDASRHAILEIIRRYIPGTKEKGLAEALLIGYKQDLDQELLQSYANTGVVHIIAISGLHLGLIYWILQWILQPIRRKKTGKWLQPLLVITGLWLFSVLAGAQPSVLRSALMFSLLVLAQSSGRKTSVFNSLAASATLLLLINPFWLWDPGYQLSYTAVTSIMLFMRPLYQQIYVANKVADWIWKMSAVTLAAQILTLPLTVYYFHQFPLLFLLSNLIAVPLSSFILCGELVLLLLSFFPFIASLTGSFLSFCIRLMNTCMAYIESIPASLWDGLNISFMQALLLLLIATGFSYGWLEKKRKGIRLAMVCLPLFVLCRTLSFIHCQQQEKLIVYNIPRTHAMELILGRNAYLKCDSNQRSLDFYLKPPRILYRIRERREWSGTNPSAACMNLGQKRILLLNRPIRLKPSAKKERIDLLILSAKARIYLKEIVHTLDIRQVVLDASVPAGKQAYWKKDCATLEIPFHSVSTNGAFVMNLN